MRGNDKMSNLRQRAFIIVLSFIIVLVITRDINLWTSKLQEDAPRNGGAAEFPKVALKFLSPEQRWKIRVAASGQHYQVNCAMNPTVPTWDIFFDMVEKQESCTEMKFFGGPADNRKGDGAKNMCMDSAMAPRPGACTVISVGINGDWSFDEATAAWGCEVFAFDPTIALPDQERDVRIHFHSLGLSGKKDTIPSRETRVPVDSYRGVLEHVGLINKTIDYLKIDIEGSEIDFFMNVLFEDMDVLQYVKQMGVEIHVWNKSVQSRDKIWNIFNRLECLGFKQIYSEINPAGAYINENGRRVSCCYELVWINEAFL